MSEANTAVLVIDDDVELRNSLGRLMRSSELNVQLFASVSGLLTSNPLDGPSCPALDVRVPAHSGLDFQNELSMARAIFGHLDTAHGDIATSVQRMKGAIEFLTMCLRDQEILDAFQLGPTRDHAQYSAQLVQGLGQPVFSTHVTDGSADSRSFATLNSIWPSLATQIFGLFRGLWKGK
jgi:FixJ family two-component response regulator